MSRSQDLGGTDTCCCWGFAVPVASLVRAGGCMCLYTRVYLCVPIHACSPLSIHECNPKPPVPVTAAVPSIPTVPCFPTSAAHCSGGEDQPPLTFSVFIYLVKPLCGQPPPTCAVTPRQGCAPHATQALAALSRSLQPPSSAGMLSPSRQAAPGGCPPRLTRPSPLCAAATSPWMPPHTHRQGPLPWVGSDRQPREDACHAAAPSGF